MSMFQILTQEGWIEVMEGVIGEAGHIIIEIFVAIYFIVFHQLVNTVSGASTHLLACHGLARMIYRTVTNYTTLTSK